MGSTLKGKTKLNTSLKYNLTRSRSQRRVKAYNPPPLLILKSYSVKILKLLLNTSIYKTLNILISLFFYILTRLKAYNL